jgi:ribosome-binding protein aMBF1 (putative translation factor)
MEHQRHEDVAVPWIHWTENQDVGSAGACPGETQKMEEQEVKPSNQHQNRCQKRNNNKQYNGQVNQEIVTWYPPLLQKGKQKKDWSWSPPLVET